MIFEQLCNTTGTEELADNICLHMEESNALHKILSEEKMSTKDRRDNLMSKMFHLCPVRNIPLHKKEPGSVKKSFYVYTSPEELLTRQLGYGIPGCGVFKEGIQD